MELADHVLPAFDPEVSEALEAELAENGVTVRVGTMVQSLIEEDGRIVGAVLSRGDGTEEIPADIVQQQLARTCNFVYHQCGEGEEWSHLCE